MLVGVGAHRIDIVLSTAVILGMLLGFSLISLMIVATYHKYFARTHAAMQKNDDLVKVKSEKAENTEIVFEAVIKEDV